MIMREVHVLNMIEYKFLTEKTLQKSLITERILILHKIHPIVFNALKGYSSSWSYNQLAIQLIIELT